LRVFEENWSVDNRLKVGEI